MTWLRHADRALLPVRAIAPQPPLVRVPV